MRTSLAKTTFGLLAVSLTLGCGPGVHHDPLQLGTGGQGQSQLPQPQSVEPMDVKPYDVRPGHTFRACGTLGEGQAYASAYSLDGTLFALGYTSGVVKIFRASDLTLVATFTKASTNINFIQFSPDGTLMASASSDDPDVEVWRVADGNTVSRMPSGGRAHELRFSANSQTLGITAVEALASPSYSTSTVVSIRSVSDGSELCRMRDATLLNLSSDGGTAWVATNDIVTAYSVQTCSVPSSVPPVNLGGGLPFAMSPDGQTIFKAYEPGHEQGPPAGGIPLVIAGIRASDGQTIWTAPTTVAWPSADMRLSPRGDFVVIANVDLWTVRAIVLLNASDGNTAAHLEPGALQSYVALSPDAAIVVTADDANEAVFWRAADGANVGQLPKSALALRADSVTFSADGTQLVAVGDDQVRFWDVQSRKLTRALRFPFTESGPNGVVLSPDSRWLAGWNGAMVIRSLLADDNRGFEGGGMGTTGAVFSADSQYLYAFSDTNASPVLRLGPDITSQAFNSSVSSGFVDSTSLLAVSPQGLVAGLSGVGFGGLRITIAQFEGTVVQTIDVASGNYTADAIAFSPDGQYVAAEFWFLSENKSLVRVWRVSDGATVNSFATPCIVGHLAFSPDGTMLATGQDVWNWRDGTSVESFLNTAEFAPVLAPDGRTIATTSGTSTITLWCRP